MAGLLNAEPAHPRGPAPVEATDDDLAAAARHDPEAFALLYRRYVDPVHRYCHRRLGSREDAEDATELIFTKVYTSLGAYRPGSFRAWLFAIAHHTVGDRLRARRPESALDDALDLPDAAPTPEDRALAADAELAVSQVLARLSSDQRRVVELRLAGLTCREIGEVLGRGLPWVKITQVRAFILLRDLIAASPDTFDGWRGTGHGR